MLTEPFVDRYAPARVHLAEGVDLPGTDGLQVWLGRKGEREAEEVRT